MLGTASRARQAGTAVVPATATLRAALNVRLEDFLALLAAAVQATALIVRLARLSTWWARLPSRTVWIAVRANTSVSSEAMQLRTAWIVRLVALRTRVARPP